jgi:hypothetical protein
VICLECRSAANLSARILRAGSNAPMGSLMSAMRSHEQCKGSTWCDCKHKVPREPKEEHSG